MVSTVHRGIEIMGKPELSCEIERVQDSLELLSDVDQFHYTLVSRQMKYAIVVAFPLRFGPIPLRFGPTYSESLVIQKDTAKDELLSQIAARMVTWAVISRFNRRIFSKAM